MFCQNAHVSGTKGKECLHVCVASFSLSAAVLLPPSRSYFSFLIRFPQILFPVSFGAPVHLDLFLCPCTWQTTKFNQLRLDLQAVPSESFLGQVPASA